MKIKRYIIQVLHKDKYWPFSVEKLKVVKSFRKATIFERELPPDGLLMRLTDMNFTYKIKEL